MYCGNESEESKTTTGGSRKLTTILQGRHLVNASCSQDYFLEWRDIYTCVCWSEAASDIELM